MPTPAQLFANKQNAKKSTGPRTAEGKARASRNSLKHGLCAEATVLPHEDPEEYEHLREVIHRDFAAKSEFEALHLDLLARAYWRLIRSSRVECGMFTKRLIALADREHAEHKEMDFDQGISVCYIHFAKEFDLHRRYETAIERSYYKALDTIKHLRGTIAELHEQNSAAQAPAPFLVAGSGADDLLWSSAISEVPSVDPAPVSDPSASASQPCKTAAPTPIATDPAPASADVLRHSQPTESITQSGTGFVSRQIDSPGREPGGITLYRNDNHPAPQQ